ncbi:MAG: hypothetical protein ABJN26_00740 [Stappiaceae bacterium]
MQRLGAMLHDCAFQPEGTQEVRPLYDAPWRGDSGPEFDAQPPIIQGLGCEWPCVPFGRSGEQLVLPSEWKTGDTQPWDDWAHGYASNNDWDIEQLDATTLKASIDYPVDTPILRLEREVRLQADRPGLFISLEIHARRETSFPLGLHPVLSMVGAAPGELQLVVPGSTRVWSFPVDVEPGRNHFSPNQQDLPLNGLKDVTDKLADPRFLPPPGQSEDLLLLSGTGGSVGLINPVQGCITTVHWDSGQIPGCLLWISNGGRDYYPWNSRVAALGIEPVVANFDLGMAHSVSSDNPIAQRGIPTTISVGPDRPFKCAYRIEIDAV